MEAAHICGLRGQLALLRPLHFGHRPAAAAWQCKVQKSEEAKCKVKKPTCSLMQLRPRLVLCAEIACCWLAHLPPAQEFIHRAGRLTREDCLQANKSYCTLHYRPEFPLGPISALSKPPTPLYTADTCTLQTPPATRVHSPRTKCRSIKSGGLRNPLKWTKPNCSEYSRHPCEAFFSPFINVQLPNVCPAFNAIKSPSLTPFSA